jgi:endonuclease-8
VPEGDTVWTTARALHRALHGQVLTGSDLRVPRLATVDLTGWRVLESTCRGKHLLLRLAESGTGRPMTLHSHLRMDGAWRIFPPGDSPAKAAGMGPGRRSSAWRGGPAHTIRAVLYTEAATAVGFHLHDLELVPTADEPNLVGHLGPDLLGPDWDPDEAARRLATHPDTPIAQALLDQTNLAGIGNLYKSELLFLRGVSPWTPVRDVPDLRGMAVLAHRLLSANAGRWTQSTTGSLRRSETTYVYGRRAQPCRRCGTLIEKAEQGERVTYWCPTCQPARPV